MYNEGSNAFLDLRLTCSEMISQPRYPCKSQTGHDTGPDSTPIQPVEEYLRLYSKAIELTWILKLI